MSESPLSLSATPWRSATPVVSFEQAHALIAAHGSPLLVIARSRIISAYQTMRAHLRDVEIFYAAKANSNAAILSLLRQEGASIDVSSAGEVNAALAAGFTPSQMLHTHPCKSEADLRACYEQGVRWFVYDNPYELDKLAAHAPDANVLLRVALSADSSVLKLSSKFGADRDESIRFLIAAERRGLNIRGLSFHLGSQCLDPRDFEPAMAIMRDVIEEAWDQGIPITHLDIGGGFPSPYRHQTVMPLDEYCDEVRASIDKHLSGMPLTLMAEPGRALCAEAVTLITTVIGKSRRQGTLWYYLDEGIYGAFSGKRPGHTDYPLVVENASSLPFSECVIAGPTCDSGDVLYRDHALPELNVGDLILVPSMGAYTSASACNFNGLPITRSIVID